MLNLPNTSLFFMALLLCSISLDVLYDLPIAIYLILYLLYSAIFFYGVSSVDSNFFIPVICKAQTADKIVSISFDDGPGEFTAEILQILQDYNVKAAFFCIGKHIPAHAPLLRQIYQQGHIIGNHSFSHHLLFDFFFSKPMLQDLQAMDKAMYDVIGLKPRLFRPPYGVTNPFVRNAIIRGDYIPIGWSVRSLDTVIKDEQQLLNKCVTALKPGAIYLFHDTQQVTRTILPTFIEQVLASGYQIVSLETLLNISAYKNS
ncbi:MAG: polysaccharide deacetylase family protein [Methylococcaceae bacterium]|nr:polysaccharide deacetylase family protein [Methylococcaceae bacterium]